MSARAALLIAAPAVPLAAGEALAATGAFAALDGDDMARLVYLGALALFVASGLFAGRRNISGDLKAFAFWIAALALLVALYGFKDDAKRVFQRFAGTLAPGLATESDGEISVARSRDGMFAVTGMANGARVSFMFDTGASAVVLTAEDAARAGFTPMQTEFSITTMTANGATTVAPVTIRELSIGAFVERDVRAFVARPGALHQSLLGQSFLNRLGSYEVRGDRLILRPR